MFAAMLVILLAACSRDNDSAEYILNGTFVPRDGIFALDNTTLASALTFEGSTLVLNNDEWTGEYSIRNGVLTFGQHTFDFERAGASFFLNGVEFIRGTVEIAHVNGNGDDGASEDTDLTCAGDDFDYESDFYPLIVVLDSSPITSDALMDEFDFAEFVLGMTRNLYIFMGVDESYYDYGLTIIQFENNADVIAALRNREIDIAFVPDLFLESLPNAGDLRSMYAIGGADDEPAPVTPPAPAMPSSPHISVIFEADTAVSPTVADMTAAMSIIRARLDRMGIHGAVVTQEVPNQITTAIPSAGVADMEHLIASIGRTALLTFQDDNGNVLLTGADVARAESASDGSHHFVSLEFTASGTTVFADATRNNIGRAILIFLDDELLASPIVNTVIADGNAIITGGFSQAQADELASTIQTGALPFNLMVVSASDSGNADISAIRSTGLEIIFEVANNPNTATLNTIAEQFHQNLAEAGFMNRHIFLSGTRNLIIRVYGVAEDAESLVARLQASAEPHTLFVLSLNGITAIDSPAMNTLDGGFSITIDMGRNVSIDDLYAISEFVNDHTGVAPISVASYIGGQAGIIMQPLEAMQREAFIVALTDRLGVNIYAVSYSYISRR